MRELQDYRKRDLALRISRKVRELIGELKRSRNSKRISIMGFCGTHEWTITHYGIRALLPKEVELIAGPGCPVCVTPPGYVDAAIRLAEEGITILTYGDAYRLPGSGAKGRSRSLAEARSLGSDVRIVYGFTDAVKLASSLRKEAVFLAVGFETTAPTTASWLTSREVPDNLSLISAYRLTPPIMRYILEEVPELPLDGIIAPGHVSAILGSRAWEFVAKDYGVPIVVAGFEPVDVLLSVLMILKQLLRGRVELDNEYTRVVKPEGNPTAKALMARCFDVVGAEWRGIGRVKGSGLALKRGFSRFDATERYGIGDIVKKSGSKMPIGCKCADVVVGKAKPTQCPLFMKRCKPTDPYGPCMVSSEGTCSIWARYGSYEEIEDLVSG